MNGKVCFFIGHRDTPDRVYPALEQAVEQLITQGVTEFYVGNHGSFDRMAARGVIAAKQHHPSGAADNALGLPSRGETGHPAARF